MLQPVAFRSFCAASMIVLAGSTAEALQFDNPNMIYADLFEIPAVRKELNLTNDQWASLKKVSQEYRRQKPDRTRFNSPEQALQHYQRLETAAKTYARQIEDRLNEAQFKRFKELSIQRLGNLSLLRKDVLEELKASPEQTSQIQEIYNRATPVRAKAPTAAEAKELKQQAAIALMKLTEPLTPEQIEAFEAMKGEAFEFPK